MSVSLKLDKDNNLLFGDNLFIIDGTESVEQDVRTRLSMWEGEYPYNTSEGVPYLDILRSANKNLFDATLRQEVLKDDRIQNAKVSVSRVKGGVATIEVRGTTKDGAKFNV